MLTDESVFGFILKTFADFFLQANVVAGMQWIARSVRAHGAHVRTHEAQIARRTNDYRYEMVVAYVATFVALLLAWTSPWYSATLAGLVAWILHFAYDVHATGAVCVSSMTVSHACAMCAFYDFPVSLAYAVLWSVIIYFTPRACSLGWESHKGEGGSFFGQRSPKGRSEGGGFFRQTTLKGGKGGERGQDSSSAGSSYGYPKGSWASGGGAPGYSYGEGKGGYQHGVEHYSPGKGQGYAPTSHQVWKGATWDAPEEETFGREGRLGRLRNNFNWVRLGLNTYVKSDGSALYLIVFPRKSTARFENLLLTRN